MNANDFPEKFVDEQAPPRNVAPKPKDSRPFAFIRGSLWASASILRAAQRPSFLQSHVCFPSGTVAPQAGFLHFTVRVQR
jgi:hypothetical protein